MSTQAVDDLRKQVRSCTHCAPYLPLEPRPIVQFSATSRLLVIGQAPGRVTHHSGIPFDDAAGERLAGWLGLNEATLHDPAKVAIVSMGLCYPGKARGGDKPPRPECAPLWHDRIWQVLPADRLTVLVGVHAHKAYIPATRSMGMTERVRRAKQFAPVVPLPHPAWRARVWMKDHPWFEHETLPWLQREVASRIGP